MPLDAKEFSKNQRPAFPEEQLRYFLGQNGSFVYEWQMFEHAFKKWATLAAISIRSGEQQLDLNLAIEVFLLHYRTLRDFFFPSRNAWADPNRFDDPIAFDFVPSWLKISSDFGPAGEKDRINKLLSHLSYSRPDLDHEWKLPEMRAALLAVLKSFVLELPVGRRGWVAPQLGL